MSDQLHFVWSHLPDLLIGFPSNRPGGLLLSVLLSIASVAVGFVLALPLGLAHHSRLRVVRATVRL